MRGDDGETPLHDAAYWGYSDMVETLLQQGIDINDNKNRIAYTPLHYAVRMNHPKTVETLLRHGADIESKTKLRGWTALHIAACLRYNEVVDVLMKHGADADARDANQQTPQMLAAQTDKELIQTKTKQ